MWTVETQYLSAERKATTGNCIIYGQGGEYIATVPAEFASVIVEAPAMVEALRWALSMAEEAILVRENGDDPEDTPDICEMHRAELERHRAILSRIEGKA